MKLKWERNTYAPIPDYNSTDNRWRIYRHMPGDWRLQDRNSPNHPTPILYTFSLAQAKAEAEYRKEQVR